MDHELIYLADLSHVLPLSHLMESNLPNILLFGSEDSVIL